MLERRGLESASGANRIDAFNGNRSMADTAGLAGRIALVTGASSGIGRRCAEALAGAGAGVAVTARRVDLIQAVAKEIEDSGGRATAVFLDVTDNLSVVEAIQSAEDRLGPIDILVNNAGVVTGGKPLIECVEDDFHHVMETNLKGVFLVTQEVVKRMLRDGRAGRVINISSIAASRPLGPYGLYSATKAGIIQLSRAMAFEWGPLGINVNTISPGFIRTEMNDAIYRTDRGKEQIKRFPRTRLGTPEVLEGALLLLAGEGGDYINGSDLVVDDGQSLQL